jgi:hypothetical protein
MKPELGKDGGSCEWRSTSASATCSAGLHLHYPDAGNARTGHDRAGTAQAGRSFVHGDTARASYVVRVFGTVWALMQFVFSPVLGALSDRSGRRPVLLLSNFGLGLDYIVMALAPTVWWLFAGSVISGITRRAFRWRVPTLPTSRLPRDARGVRNAQRSVRTRLRSGTGTRCWCSMRLIRVCRFGWRPGSACPMRRTVCSC